jgi:alpha-L-fucosidase
MERRALLRLLPATTGLALAAGRTALARPGAEAEAPLPAPPDLGWWREARFGMFVHWGPVALRGTEIGWSRGDAVPEAEYDALYRRFDPRGFDARAWARLARESGMRYLVLTTKHHDGFCLWDSALTDYDVMSTPFARDVTRELADACRDEGLVFGAYHSICDWRHPDYPLGSPGGKTRKPAPDMERYVLYLKGQLAELLQRYGPLGVLWFDGEWEEPWSEERGRDLYRFCRGLQPSVVINNRVAKGRQDMAGTTAAGAFGGDYDTPEQRIGRFQPDRPWESCITIATQWAWKPDDRVKSLAECVRTLVTCAGGDGNLLLNVGPRADGTVEPEQAARLREIGGWLAANGESVYGTRGGPVPPAPWGATTHRDRALYVHVLERPESGALELPALEARVERARLLAGGEVRVETTPRGLRLQLAPEQLQPLDTVVRLELDRPLPPRPAVPAQARA